MLGMKNHFDISGSIEIREVNIVGVACIYAPINVFPQSRGSMGVPWRLDQQKIIFLGNLTEHLSLTQG